MAKQPTLPCFGFLFISMSNEPKPISVCQTYALVAWCRCLVVRNVQLCTLFMGKMVPSPQIATKLGHKFPGLNRNGSNKPKF